MKTNVQNISFGNTYSNIINNIVSIIGKDFKPSSYYRSPSTSALTKLKPFNNMSMQLSYSMENKLKDIVVNDYFDLNNTKYYIIVKFCNHVKIHGKSNWSKIIDNEWSVNVEYVSEKETTLNRHITHTLKGRKYIHNAILYLKVQTKNIS